MNEIQRLRVADIALSRLDTAFCAGKGNKSSWRKYTGEECVMDFAEKTVNEILDTYLKDIWNDFKPDDESTWPAKAGHYLIKTEHGFTFFYWHGDSSDFWEGSQWRYAKCYADPAHLTPREGD